MRVFCSLVLLLSACTRLIGNDDIATACTAIAQADCNLRSSCTSGGNISQDFGDLDTCITRETMSCTLAANAPDTGETPSAIRACVAAFGTYSCVDFFDNDPPQPCSFLGQRQNGGACAFGGQCKSGYCTGARSSLCGTCADGPTDGASCTDDGCGRGQVCEDRTFICVTPSIVGNACDNNTQPCQFGLACEYIAADTPGTCITETAEPGDACSSSSTNTAVCDATKNIQCQGPVVASRTCQPEIYAADGQPCGELTNGKVYCATSGTCITADGVIALVGQTGTCRAAVTEGQPCDSEAGPPCLLPSRCVVTNSGTSGTCALPEGSSCD